MKTINYLARRFFLQYEANRMLSEALKTYDLILRSKIYVINGKLQVNKGNLFFSMGDYNQAVKLYKMALDTVHPDRHFGTGKLLKFIARSVSFLVCKKTHGKEQRLAAYV